MQGGEEAEKLKQAIDGVENATVIGEFAFGTNERRRRGTVREGPHRQVHLALGDNHNAYPGGQNSPSLHLDGVFLNATMWIEDDDTAIGSDVLELDYLYESTHSPSFRIAVSSSSIHIVVSRKRRRGGASRRSGRPGTVWSPPRARRTVPMRPLGRRSEGAFRSCRRRSRRPRPRLDAVDRGLQLLRLLTRPRCSTRPFPPSSVQRIGSFTWPSRPTRA